MQKSDCPKRRGDSFRFFFGRPFLLATAFGAAILGGHVWAATSFLATGLALVAAFPFTAFDALVWPAFFYFLKLALGLAGLFYLAKLALRLAKTGTLRRAADSDEARFWSFRFLGRTILATALGAGFLGGFYALLALAGNVPGPEFLGLLNALFWVIGSVAVFAPAFVAATLEFLAFEFAEISNERLSSVRENLAPGAFVRGAARFPVLFRGLPFGGIFRGERPPRFWGV